MPVGNMLLGPAMSRDQLVAQMQAGTWGGRAYAAAPTGDVSIPDSARLGVYYGVVRQLRRRLRVFDLCPSQPMDGASFTFTQEQGSLDTAAETAEVAIKPAGDLQLVDATVEAKTIAHWFKIPRQQLADVPALATTAENRLTYGVMRRLENQIVAGDGIGENILGVLHTTGIGSVAFAAGEALSDLTLDAISTVLVSDAEPNGIVANPLDVATMLKAKATGSGERLDSDGAFATPPTEMWGLPLVQSKVMPLGQALVGDWSTCTVFVREAVNLRISDADQDDFVRNRVTFLGEGRFGLGVFQPAAFCLVHFA
jgi:HK97 family phage major capsid protein